MSQLLGSGPWSRPSSGWDLFASRTVVVAISLVIGATRAPVDARALRRHPAVTKRGQMIGGPRIAHLIWNPILEFGCPMPATMLRARRLQAEDAHAHRSVADGELAECGSHRMRPARSRRAR